MSSNFITKSNIYRTVVVQIEVLQRKFCMPAVKYFNCRKTDFNSKIEIVYGLYHSNYSVCISTIKTILCLSKNVKDFDCSFFQFPFYSQSVFSVFMKQFLMPSFRVGTGSFPVICLVVFASLCLTAL